MRACVIRATGSLDHLQLADVPDPAAVLGPRDVRVAIRAAALNHLDLFVMRGLPHAYTFPHILGADGAGVVDAVGAEVRSVRPGDRVMLNPGISDYTCDYCRADAAPQLGRGGGVLARNPHRLADGRDARAAPAGGDGFDLGDRGRRVSHGAADCEAARRARHRHQLE